MDITIGFRALKKPQVEIFICFHGPRNFDRRLVIRVIGGSTWGQWGMGINDVIRAENIENDKQWVSPMDSEP